VIFGVAVGGTTVLVAAATVLLAESWSAVRG